MKEFRVFLEMMPFVQGVFAKWEIWILFVKFGEKAKIVKHVSSPFAFFCPVYQGF